MPMMPNDPVVGGNVLRRPAIQSPNFVTGVSGWTINADGTAEFQNLTARGNISATSITNTPIGSANISNSDFHDGTIERTVITLDASGGLILVYATTVTVTTLTVGPSFTSPANMPATGLVECWGGGAGGVFGGKGGGAGGAAEYAAEGAFPFSPSTVYPIQIGQGGQGGTSVLFVASGTATIFNQGNSPNVTANPGLKGQFTTAGLGGSGSPNSVHFNGGNGGTGFTGSGVLNAGGGGGASGAPAGAGGNGGNGTSSAAGTGGVAQSGGGNGGDGGRGATAGQAAGGVGGGGGGGGSLINGTNPTNGGPGANGKIRITYQTGRTLIAALSPAAGSDVLSNAFAAAYTGQVTAFHLGSAPTTAEVWQNVTPPAGWSGTLRFKALAQANFAVVDFELTNAGASGNVVILGVGALPVAYRPTTQRDYPLVIQSNTAPANSNQRFFIKTDGSASTFALPASTTGISATQIYPLD